MSIDEAISVHEITMAPLRDAFGFTGVLYFAWVVIATPLLVVTGLLFLPFLIRQPPELRWRMVLSGMIYVSGAFGLELVGGELATGAGMDSLPYILGAIAEETLEIVGLTLFAAALIAHRARREVTINVR